MKTPGSALRAIFYTTGACAAAGASAEAPHAATSSTTASVRVNQFNQLLLRPNIWVSFCQVSLGRWPGGLTPRDDDRAPQDCSQPHGRLRRSKVSEPRMLPWSSRCERRVEPGALAPRSAAESSL